MLLFQPLVPDLPAAQNPPPAAHPTALPHRRSTCWCPSPVSVSHRRSASCPNPLPSTHPAHPTPPSAPQIYLLFRARLAPPFTFAARAPESLEAALFRPEDIPWDQLAFSSVSIALKQ